jgi:hypothetical protein
MYLEIYKTKNYRREVYIRLHKDLFCLLEYRYINKYPTDINLYINADMMARRLLPLCIDKHKDLEKRDYMNRYIIRIETTSNIIDIIKNKSKHSVSFYNTFCSLLRTNETFLNILFTEFNFEKCNSVNLFKTTYLDHYIKTFASIISIEEF